MKKLLFLIVAAVSAASAVQAASTGYVQNGDYRFVPGGSKLALVRRMPDRRQQLEVAFRRKQIREVSDTAACLSWKEVTGENLGPLPIWYEYRIEWRKADCTLTSCAFTFGVRKAFALPLGHGHRIREFVLSSPKKSQ